MYDITYNLPCNHASWFSWVSIPSYDQDPWHTILHYILNTYLHLYNDSFHPSTNIDYHYNTKRDPDRLYVNQSVLDHGSIMRTCIMWHARFRCNSTTKASTKSDRLQESAVDGETDTKLRIFLNLHYLLHIIDWNEIRKKNSQWD